MAAVSSSLSEEQFLCSICLEVFTDPVTTPCGHSFCCTCINKHWDNSVHCSCPLCKLDFNPRPQLKVNTFMSEMVSMFRSKPQREILVMQPQSTAPGEVVCDLCPEPRLRALKSCLVCLLSYCESHLQPHLTNPHQKKHQLIQPLPNLEEHICPEHGQLLELFCRDHSLLVCLKCTSEEHKDHQTVPLKEQGEVQQATLKQQIKNRQAKVQEIQCLVEMIQRNADSEIQEGLRVFNTLMACVQQSADSFKQSIEEKHKKSKEEAVRLIEQIQTEISELERRGAEMEQLWSSGDHLHFVQTFSTVKPPPQLNDWTKKTVRIPVYKGKTSQAVSELRRRLNTEMMVFRKEFKIAQGFGVEVSLDPKTAHTYLVLSEDLKQVHVSPPNINIPDHPERFKPGFYVLGKQNFSSGKFYFEVQVKEKTSWILGVANESVDRKISNRTVQTGHWLLYMSSDGQYKTSEVPSVVFPVHSPPGKVGVFVDYEEGLVSFFDVDEQSLIYSLTDCCFAGQIRPLFNPIVNKTGLSNIPLVLTPIGD